MLTAFIPAAILALIVLVVLSLRGRVGSDMSATNFLALYLNIASLAGLVVLAVGVASLLNVGFAAIAGNDFAYGRPPDTAAVVGACPPNTPECEAARARQLASNPRERLLEQRDRRRGDDLLRGLTFTVFGALFWGAHRLARRRWGTDELASSFHRGYLMGGTLLFGLVTVVLLPWGLYQALSTAILPPAPSQFSSGIADTLGAGIAALPIWLIYVRLVARDVRLSTSG